MIWIANWKFIIQAISQATYQSNNLWPEYQTISSIFKPWPEFDKQTILDHLNTELVLYSDLHCSNYFKKGYISPAARNSLRTLSTSACTVISTPLKLKSLRFFAAPKPPGNTSPEKCSGTSLSSGCTAVLAIRADSERTHRICSIGWPVWWSITWAWNKRKKNIVVSSL